MKEILSKRYLGNIVCLLAVLTLMVGCFGHFRNKHKEYTFDEKFEYHSGKVLKHIKKVVKDEERLSRIKENIFSHKDDLKIIYDEIEEGKKELKGLILEAKDRESAKNRLASLGDRKVSAFNILIDIIFEVKEELSEEEWKEVSAEFEKKCSWWWK